jgi:hypothetical protein
MRPVTAVMVDIDAEHVLELSPADDQDPVEAVAPDGAEPALGERVRLRRRKRLADDLPTGGRSRDGPGCEPGRRRRWPGGLMAAGIRTLAAAS